MISIWVLLICMVILSGCSWGKDQSANTENMDAMSEEEKSAYMKGSIIDRQYENEFFDLELELPNAWVTLSEDEMARLMETGEDLAADSGAMYDLTSLEILNLLGVFKYPFDEVVVMNPNLYITAERIDESMGIDTGEAYLEKASAGIEHFNETIVFGNTMDRVNIQEKAFTRRQATIDLGYMVVYQVHYVALVKGYALNIIATYMEEEDLRVIEAMLGKEEES